MFYFRLLALGGFSWLISIQNAVAFHLVPTTQHCPRASLYMVAYHPEEQDGEDEMIISSDNAPIIPSAEEALHSSLIVRRMRTLRDNRGLVKKRKETDDAEIMRKMNNNGDGTSTAISEEERIVLSRQTRNKLLVSNHQRVETSATSKQRQSVKTVRLLSSSTTQRKASSSASAKITTKLTIQQASVIKRSNGIDLPYSSTIKALKVYYNIHGDLTMPRRYLVPEDEAYPKEWHGVDLAGTVYNMKWWQQHVKQKRERVQELNKMSFLWERLQPEWNLVLEALITYKSLHGNVMVPGKFVVPYHDNQWPKATWGVPLGNCVYRIRHRNDFLRGSDTVESRREQLDGLGFVWDVPEHRFQRFYSALRHFAVLEHGRAASRNEGSSRGRNIALRVPSTFVVPTNDRDWPEASWGYPLGSKCTAVRQKQLYVKDHPHRQQLLEGLRFQWHRGTGNASLGWLAVVHAAAIYSKLHNRKLDVPYNFVVPRPPLDAGPGLRVDTRTAVDENDVWPWPEYLWGLPLGQRLKDVRQKGAYLKGANGEARRQQLDGLGFNWTPKRGRPTKKKTTKKTD